MRHFSEQSSFDIFAQLKDGSDGDGGASADKKRKPSDKVAREVAELLIQSVNLRALAQNEEVE